MSGLDRMRNRSRQTKQIKRTKPKLEAIITDDIINVEYCLDYPIDRLHQIIIEKITHHVGMRSLVERRTVLEEKLRDYCTRIEQSKILREIGEIDNGIEGYRTNRTLCEYIEEAEPLVEEYLSLTQYVEEISFVLDIAEEHGEKMANVTGQKARRVDIIQRYFKVAGKYAKMEIMRTIDTRMTICIICDFDFEGKDVPISETGEQVCPGCNSIRYAYCMAGHKGVKNASSNRGYDVLTTFKKEGVEFQGLGKPYIDPETFELLDKHFQSIGLPSSEEIKNLTPDEFGLMPGTSLDLLVEGLNAIGHPSLYKKANRIARDLWGWKLVDFQDIWPVIILDFIELQGYYPHVDKKGRTSNICSQHRLLQHLRLRDINVHMKQFKLPGPEALLASEDIWKQMCIKAGREYKPLFGEREKVGDISGIVIVNEKTGSKTYYTTSGSP